MNESAKHDELGADRRREPRFPASAVAHIRVISSRSEKLEGAVRVIEASRSGLRIRLPFRLFTGTHVEIIYRKTVIFAEVRHCRRLSDHEFDVGLVIEETVGKPLSWDSATMADQ
jgi:PilZ domain